jgi:hypothetical protein
MVMVRLPGGVLGRLRGWLELWNAIGSIETAWTTAAGLGQVLTAVLQWSRDQGRAGAWQTVLERVLADEVLLELCAAALRYLLTRGTSVAGNSSR